jgi:hypothetical protein
MTLEQRLALGSRCSEPSEREANPCHSNAGHDTRMKRTRLRNGFARNYVTTIGSTPVLSVAEGIAAGTSETQRGIIANCGVGARPGLGAPC